MKKPFLERLSHGPVLFDGGMGSQLIAQGLELGQTPELWNVDHPDRIQAIHASYFEAGADVVLTNTFGGTSVKLGEKKLGDRAEELNRQAVANARSACPPNGYVAGDIGPTGQFLPPVGKTTEEELYATYYGQAGVLLQAGVDLIVVETMYDLREATQAVRAVRDLDPAIPLIATMTFDHKKRGFFTIMGDRPALCFETLTQLGADVVGANCTLDSRDMVAFVESLGSLVEDYILCLQPNAGQPKVVGGVTSYSQEPAVFAEDLATIVQAGVRVVGGCCGTNPDFISQAATKIRNLQ